ncbi:NUDIX domain-containing protein [Salinicola sp. JS01]|uniref:nucleotide triphosphate diphosphatase NUDT15 n=1 Tax=Salinicola sp. JS01 TaxID=3050071 RepID=UPI00255BD13B|nr:NUDIX domain-containing protein [Salinicola sp. JS01]WIX31513.1 NUDIX domain-containing protein [Salinicola sp. JS01]
MPAPKSRIGVGLILTRGAGEILLGYRIKAGETPCWCMPGGHVEPNETFAAAARRELHEETGILTEATIEIGAFLHQLNPDCTAITVAAHLHLQDPPTPRVTEPEVFDQWRWFPCDALPRPLFPASAALLAQTAGQPLPDGWHAYPRKAP